MARGWNVAQPFIAALEREPGVAALRTLDGQVTTRAALRARTLGLAAELSRRGMRAGQRVVIQTPGGELFTAAAVACMWLGAVPVLAEPAMGREAYLATTTSASPDWLLTHPLVRGLNLVPGAPAALRARDVDLPPTPGLIPNRLSLTARTLDAWADQAAWAPPAADVAPEDDALMLFTGGTTTQPKGVRLGHRAVAGYLDHIAQVIEDAPPFHTLLADTPQQALYAIRLGKTAAPSKGRKERRARDLWRALQSGAVDAYFGAPYIWQRLMEAHGHEALPHTLKLVLLGSAPVTPAFLSALDQWLPETTHVRCLYGLSEAGPVCAASVREKVRWQGAGDLVGPPVPGVHVTIDRPADSPEDAPGEVLVYSDSLYTGYWGQPERAPQEPLRTGDLGRLVRDEAGAERLVLLGRKKEMLVRRAVNLYPGVLEPIIARALDAPAALVGLWDARAQDEVVVLWIEAPSILQDTEARLRATLGADATPDHILSTERLPVTGRQNKLDRRALRQQALDRLNQAHLSASIPGQHLTNTLTTPPAPEAPEAHALAELPGARVPVQWHRLDEKHRILRAHRTPEDHLRRERRLRTTLATINQLGWALDDLLYTEWRHVRLRGPVFILGHQRSGTTWLHRALVEDVLEDAHAQRFASMLVPALSARRAADALLQSQPIARAIDDWQARTLGPLDPIHRLRLDAIEEDEFALWTIQASGMNANDAATSPAVAAALDHLRQPEAWPDAEQREAMAWYRACLLKTIAASGQREGWVVAKNPAFTRRIPLLYKEFPNARFIYLWRDPRKTIPSRLSLIQAIWRLRDPEAPDMDAAQVEAIVTDSLRTYDAAHELRALPPERRVVVPFDALTSQPHETIAHIHDALQLGALQRGWRARIDARQQRRADKGAHRYTAEAFGLSDEVIAARFADHLTLPSL